MLVNSRELWVALLKAWAEAEVPGSEESRRRLRSNSESSGTDWVYMRDRGIRDTWGHLLGLLENHPTSEQMVADILRDYKPDLSFSGMFLLNAAGHHGAVHRKWESLLIELELYAGLESALRGGHRP